MREHSMKSFTLQLSADFYALYSLFAWLTLVALKAPLWLFLVFWKVGRTLRERWRMGRAANRHNAECIEPYVHTAHPLQNFIPLIYSILEALSPKQQEILFTAQQTKVSNIQACRLSHCHSIDRRPCACEANTGHDTQTILPWLVSLFVYLCLLRRVKLSVTVSMKL